MSLFYVKKEEMGHTTHFLVGHDCQDNQKIAEERRRESGKLHDSKIRIETVH